MDGALNVRWAGKGDRAEREQAIETNRMTVTMRRQRFLAVDQLNCWCRLYNSGFVIRLSLWGYFIMELGVRSINKVNWPNKGNQNESSGTYIDMNGWAWASKHTHTRAHCVRCTPYTTYDIVSQSKWELNDIETGGNDVEQSATRKRDGTRCNASNKRYLERVKSKYPQLKKKTRFA